MKIVNKPEVSGSIKVVYIGLNVLIIALIIFFAFISILTSMKAVGLVVIAILAVIEAIMLSLYNSLYKTRYVITEDKLIIKTSKLIGGNKEISIKDIKSIQRTLIPFGLRLFGASFYDGYYYIPSLGKAFLAITNFKDGLLIKTKNSNYIITPKDPISLRKKLWVG